MPRSRAMCVVGAGGPDVVDGTDAVLAGAGAGAEGGCGARVECEGDTPVKYLSPSADATGGRSPD